MVLLLLCLLVLSLGPAVLILGLAVLMLALELSTLSLKHETPKPEAWLCHGSKLHSMACVCLLVVNIVKRFGGAAPPRTPLLSRGIAT